MFALLRSRGGRKHHRLTASLSFRCTGENMIQKRQERLKMWINRVCRHPVLSRDEKSLRHFLTCPTGSSGGKSVRRTPSWAVPVRLCLGGGSPPLRLAHRHSLPPRSVVS